MKAKQWVAEFEANTPVDFPTLLCGWPDAETNITWSAYQEYCQGLVEDMVEDRDAPNLPIFDDWQTDEREKVGDLGFSHEKCDICHALPGDRHAVTARSAEGTCEDYLALRVCGDCLQYIANSEVPDWLENE